MSTDDTMSVTSPPNPPSEPYHEAALTRGMEHLRPYVSVPIKSAARSSAIPQDSNTATPPQEPHAITTTTSTDTDTDPETNTNNNPIPEPATVYGIPSNLIDPHRHPPTATRSNPQKRRDPFQFGSRYLEQHDDIFEFNAWDHVAVDAQYLSFAETQYTLQRTSPVSASDLPLFNSPGMPAKWWDRFYTTNKSSFFKDRKWLFQEFPVLEQVTRAGAGPQVVLEIGAGAGNTAFPVLKQNENTELKLWAVDFAPAAVQVMRAADEYVENQRVAQSEGREMNVRVSVYDLAGEGLPEGLEAGSVDVVVLVFTFSALAPGQWERALRNVWSALRPGGLVLFRDYGRGDLAQVRFKKGRWLQENFYVRGDGTRVYFFDEEELRGIWCGERPLRRERRSAPAEGVEETVGADGGGETAGGDGGEETAGEGEDGETVEEDGEARSETILGQDTPRFEILDLAADRRMLVNRKRRLKMYRCWLQGRFQKPLEADTSTA